MRERGLNGIRYCSEMYLRYLIDGTMKLETIEVHGVYYGPQQHDVCQQLGERSHRMEAVLGVDLRRSLGR